MLRQLYVRLRSLWRWRRQEAELEEEIRFHLAEEIEERVAAGMSPEEAQAAARRDFGNVPLIRELTRDTWGWGPAERLLQDLRGAFRMMRRQPTFTAVATGTLALGDRRQRRDVQRVEHRAVPAAAVPVPARARHAVDRGAEPGSSRGPVGFLEHRGVATPESELRGHRGLRQRGADAHARRRDATGSRGQGVAKPASVARRAAAARTELLGRRGGGAASCRGHQSSVLAGQVRWFARRARRVRRARRTRVTHHRRAARRVRVREPRCRRLRASHAGFRTGRPAAWSGGATRGS